MPDSMGIDTPYTIRFYPISFARLRYSGDRFPDPTQANVNRVGTQLDPT
ncbi:MAG: hypothetical protein AAGG51_02785 [Cyanobacteria bacterium P01_G01_bin.54]